MTTLGTPLTPSATRVMLLGSGELGKEVLVALQRLGVETIAVDRYSRTLPGQQVAHHAHTIAMSDPAQLKALIEAERPHLVVPEIEAIATPMLQELEDAGVVKRDSRRRVPPGSPWTARASAAWPPKPSRVPTSPYKFCDSFEPSCRPPSTAWTAKAIGYPCIVKPVMSSLGQGPEQDRRPGRRAESLGLRHGRRPRQPRPGHRRGFHRLRLRDHPADRARARRRFGRRNPHPVLRAHRPCAGERRLRGKLAAAADVDPGAAREARRHIALAVSPATWAARACSASNSS